MRLTADYLAERGPTDLRWALAGRSLDKLERERERLAAAHPGLSGLELVVADSGDPASLADLARPYQGRASPPSVRTSTVARRWPGPAPTAGTDYCDITGEGEFVDQVYVAHHATAESTGARLVHCCGFDSVPHDLGAMYTVEHLPGDVPITVRGVVRAGALPSGGTFETALTGMSRVRQIRGRRGRAATLEQRPVGRSSRAVGGKPHRDSVLGYWLLPLPTIDPAIVARSGAALPSYGPEFRYSHYAGTKSLPYAVGGAAAMAGLGLASQVKLARDFLMRKYPAGDGPDPARRDRSWFTVDFVGEGGGERVHTRSPAATRGTPRPR